MSSHQYAFAHWTVRDYLFEHTSQFFELLHSSEQPNFLAWLWFATDERTGTQITNFDAIPTSAEVCSLGGRLGVLIELPEPSAIGEAYFVLAVAPSSAITGELSPESVPRYFLLEAGSHQDGVPRTVLCEWTQEAHVNYGDGPAASIESFVLSVEKLL